MTAYKDLTKEELLELKSGLQAQFEEVKARGLKLDMSRGKPAAAQLNLSMEMMNILNSGTDLVCEDGVDCRNYGTGWNRRGKTASGRYDGSTKRQRDRIRKFQSECDV